MGFKAMIRQQHKRFFEMDEDGIQRKEAFRNRTIQANMTEGDR